MSQAAPASAHPSTTVVNTVAGAPQIGLIGDSTLAGVRWYGQYGKLQTYSYVFDAESCRRTLEPSCWSREGYRPDTALQTMQRLSGKWGDVLVMMAGYDDSSYLFDDAIDAIVAEARRQGIGHVVWLTLRTEGVSYEEPLHQANGRTYRESNRVLLSRAARLGGYLQVADWATHSVDHAGWLEPDGVHVTKTGAEALTAFIADQVGRVLDGDTVTPAEPPWYPLVEGDTGDAVVRVQQALVGAGIDVKGGADGTFGLATTQAVSAFQRQHGLDVSGVVDQRTAVALGLRQGPQAAASATTTVAVSTAPAAISTPATSPETQASSGGMTSALPWLALIGVNVVLAWYVRRRLHVRRQRLAASSLEDGEADADADGPDRRDPAAHFVD
ncbi:MAG TPA: peptidoglycan-binding protein [Acidimicrobiales bacterium]